MKRKRLAIATVTASVLLVIGSGSAAASKPAPPVADVWIEALTITCPATGGLEVTLVADASAGTTIGAGEVILTEMREVASSNGFYPFVTSIPVAEWWETQHGPGDGLLTISFWTADEDFNSTMWDGNKHHFWNLGMTTEEPSDDAWFRARGWVEGTAPQRGRSGPERWDLEELDVYQNCQTGESFTPTTNPWDGWNFPAE